MYIALKRHLGTIAASWVCAIWYALLVVLVLYCAFSPQAEFEYLAF